MNLENENEKNSQLEQDNSENNITKKKYTIQQTTPQDLDSLPDVPEINLNFNQETKIDNDFDSIANTIAGEDLPLENNPTHLEIDQKIEEQNKQSQIDSIAEFKFKFHNFEGPLDLLVELIKDKKMSLMQLDVLELANQYQAVIKMMKQEDLEIAGEYLTMASRLVWMKSKIILNRPEEQEEIEEEKQRLIQDIIEQKQFKEIQEALRTFQDSRMDIYIKKPSNIDEFIVDNDDERLDGNSSITTLITVLRRMFERVYARNLRRAQFDTIKLTSADQTKFIYEVFGNRDEVGFEEIFTQPSLVHFVITLMAVLDLANKQYLTLIQETQYGPIRIIRKRGIENEE